MADVATHRPAQRPRTASMLSWGSHKSKESAPKMDLTETERDKRRITGKADPSVAMNELQPSVEAMQKSTLVPLRTMQFRDHKGDLITDPDRSNPTRPRMERPLDTIRSFEAAIDSSYSRRRNTTQPGKYHTSAPRMATQHGCNSLGKELCTRRIGINSQSMYNATTALSDENKSLLESDTSSGSFLNAKMHDVPFPVSVIPEDEDLSKQDAGSAPGVPTQRYDEPALTYMINEDVQSRRSSFYQGLASPQPRTPGSFNNNPYFERQPDSRPESIYDQTQQQQQQQQQQYGGYQAGSGNGWNGNRRMPHGRMTSEPVYSHQQQRQHGYQQSYDTATASSSGTYQTEQGTASTEPSSYNGSYGEINQAGYSKPLPPAHQETYGIEFANNDEDDYGQPVNNYYQQQGPQSPQSPHAYPTNGAQARGRSYGSPVEASAPPPPPPPHANGTRNALRKPVARGDSSMGAANGNYYPPSGGERPKAEKRKSWLSRRFSKNG